MILGTCRSMRYSVGFQITANSSSLSDPRGAAEIGEQLARAKLRRRNRDRHIVGAGLLALSTYAPPISAPLAQTRKSGWSLSGFFSLLGMMLKISQIITYR